MHRVGHYYDKEHSYFLEAHAHGSRSLKHA